MHRPESFLFALLLAGCGPGITYYPNDSGETGFTDDTDPGDDTDTQDTDIPWSDECHPADPVDLSGWTRTYDVVNEGSAGNEVQTGMGGGQVRSVLTGGGDEWDVVMQHSCDANGRAVLEGWTGSVKMNMEMFPQFPIPLEFPSVTATHSNPRPYLADLNTLTNGGSWNYSYTMQVQATDAEGQAQNHAVETTGQYSAQGMEAVTVAGQTFDAYLILHQYTQAWPQMTGLGTTKGFAELYYVPGIGLVREVAMDAEDQVTELMRKELTSYTGLTPQ